MSKSENALPVDPAPRTIPPQAARLGPGLQFQGDLTGSEDLVIQGKFRGKIFLLERTLTIDRQAEVEGDIEAGDVNIAGTLSGNIRATGRVVLEASAEVKGDILAARISIQDGARFKGAIQMNKP
jgi:cytoskeletal protein CcmA (bactofilin family)